MGGTDERVFPSRVDHIYCIWVEGDEADGGAGKPAATYIGRSVTPGRALKHFKSHNSQLFEALNSGRRWRITYQELKAPSVEDLTILESAAIDAVSSDRRFAALNQSLGTAADKPRHVDPQTQKPPKDGVLMGWERMAREDGHDELRVVRRADKDGGIPVDDVLSWWATPPLTRKKNRKVVRRALRRLIASVQSGGPVALAKPYFTYLAELPGADEGRGGAKRDDASEMPQAGRELAIRDLWDILGGAFVYVQINDETFEDDGRQGLAPGLDLRTLQDRVVKYWDKGSSSTTRGRTLQRLADAADRAELPDGERPRWLVGVASGSKVILCVWRLDLERGGDWIDSETQKVVFPTDGPADWATQRQLIGARIADDVDLKRKAVKWIDTPEVQR